MNHLSQGRRAIEAFRDLYAPEADTEQEKTIACPQCGKTIKADSLYCPFCEHDLSQPVVDESPHATTGAALLVFGALLLLDLAVPLLFLLMLQPFSGHWIVAGATVLLLVGLKVVIATRAIESRLPQGHAPFINAAALFLLAFVPIGSWLAIAYASKRIALSRLAHLVYPGLAVLILAVDAGLTSGFIPVLDGRGLIAGLDSPYQRFAFVPFAPTRTPSPVPLTLVPLAPTHTLSPVPTYGGNGQGCVSALSVTPSNVGQELCVRGVVRVGYGRHGNYYISFSTDPTAFTMIGYDWGAGGVNPGDCIIVRGIIEQLASYPVMVIESKDLALCP